MFYNIVVNQYYSINLHCIALMKCNIHINIHKTINSLFDFGKNKTLYYVLTILSSNINAFVLLKERYKTYSIFK